MEIVATEVGFPHTRSLRDFYAWQDNTALFVRIAGTSSGGVYMGFFLRPSLLPVCCSSFDDEDEKRKSKGKLSAAIWKLLSCRVLQLSDGVYKAGEPLEVMGALNPKDHFLRCLDAAKLAITS